MYKKTYIPKIGDGVILKTRNKDFIHGYVEEMNKSKILIKLESKSIWCAPEKILQFRYGMLRSIGILNSIKSDKKKTITLVKKKIVNSKSYMRRKTFENARLIYDIHSLGFVMKDSNLLALDDFVGKSNKPNTTNTWIKHGGSVDRVWVPNPDNKIANAVTDMGGHGLTMTLGEMLDSPNIRNTLPRFDVAYIDLCGFFNSHRDDIEKLFHYHPKLLADRVLLHFTICKREGSMIIENDLFSALEEWTEKYHYGRVMMLPMKHSEKMWKGAFLIMRNS